MPDSPTQDELARQERYLQAAERAAAEAKRHLEAISDLYQAAREQYAAAANDVLLISQRVRELREEPS